ncbi:MAG: DUF1007 family protein [Spirochaetaceae bacterium]|nr:MAG: DUF1007 family protein [Spirochaetaceae bacterium]
MMKIPQRLRPLPFVTLIALISLLIPHALSAHPHVFIDSRVIFQFNERELEGFWAEWAFDELFTAMIVVDFGAPRERPFPPDVIEAIQKGAFSNLQFYDYFTYVFFNGRRHAVDGVQEFTAFIRDHRIVYRFFVPFRVPISRDFQTVRVRMYDETFFTDIAFQRNDPARVQGPLTVTHETRVFRNEGVPIEYDATNQSVRREGMLYTGLTFPWEAEIRFRNR